MTVLAATDLDRTLIYSAAAGGRTTVPLAAVERFEGRDVSFMTARAAARLADLAERVVLVPVTTRVPAQYGRVRLPGPPPRFAVTANGGFLHADGRVDESWSAHVAARLRAVAPLDEIWEHVARVCRPEWTVKIRNAEGLFCYAVVERAQLPSGFLAECETWASARGWRTSMQGRKLYWVPQPLTKSAAVAEIADRLGVPTVLAAGDSLLDLDLVAAANRAVVPAHGELHATGWSAAHVDVTTRSGVAAGEEIVDWFLSYR